uniref:hypothetical protein n=1 Tax=Cellvibrio fontiphilus TaxID=1815559 RepID=UPI002B4BC5C6|nr:hypothetical protein [Cellvibrio fontiphilus]
MSKNIVTYAKHVISLFTEIEAVEGAEKIRIKPSEDTDVFKEELAVFRGTKLHSQANLIHNVKIGTYNNNLFVITNVDDYLKEIVESQLGSFGILKTEITCPLFITITKDLNLKINPNKKLFIKDSILSQHNDPTYLGHDWEELLECIEPFSVFKLSDDCIYNHSDLFQLGYLTYSYISPIINDRIAPIIDQYRNLLLLSSSIPKENIFFSFTSTHWPHAFLELYRCIEKIYKIPSTIKLKQEIGYAGQAKDLARHCNDILSWRKNHSESLKQLLSDIDESDLLATKISESTPFSNCIEDGKVDIERVSNTLYSIRNQLVHQPEGNIIELNDNDWIKAIEFIIFSCTKLYIKYSNEL